jgi:hypothetical protein
MHKDQVPTDFIMTKSSGGLASTPLLCLYPPQTWGFLQPSWRTTTMPPNVGFASVIPPHYAGFFKRHFSKFSDTIPRMACFSSANSPFPKRDPVTSHFLKPLSHSWISLSFSFFFFYGSSLPPQNFKPQLTNHEVTPGRMFNCLLESLPRMSNINLWFNWAKSWSWL